MPKHTGNEECPEDEDRLKQETQPIIPRVKCAPQSEARLRQALGFPRQPPCAATLHTVLRRVDREAGEAKRGAWAEGLLSGTPAPEVPEEGIAVDGKTLRGSQQQGAPGVPLRSALAHRLGVPLAQQAVADKTNEMPATIDL